MLAKCRFSGWLGVLAVAGVAASAADAAPANLTDLLRSLSASGYDILYSSDLVTSDLIVPETADSRDPLIRAKQALAVYHLELKSDGQRRFIVTSAIAAPVTQPVTASPASEASLDEVTVFASRYVLEAEQSSAAGSYAHDDVEQMPGAQQDALRSIRTVPGLADNLSSRPYVRGAFLEDVLVRFDGIPLMDPFHFKNFQNLISPFDPASVGRIDVYTGGFPVRYGTRSGGVIDITPRSVDSGYVNSLGANLLGYDLSSVGHSASWPLDWLATVRQSTPNIVLQPRGDIGEPSYSDALARLRWQVDPTMALTFGWLMMDDRVTSSSDPNAQQGSSHDRDVYSWIVADWTPSSELHSRSSLAVTDMERTLDGTLNLGSAASGQLRDDRETTTVELRTDWTYLQTPSLLWDAGAEGTFESTGLTFSRQESLDAQLATSLGRLADTSVSNAQTLRATVLGLYGSGRYRWRKLEIEIGSRADYQDYHGLGAHTQLSPRVNVRFDPSGAWRLYGSWGHFHQAQRVDEWRSEASQSAPDPAAHVVELIGGLEHDSSATLHWRVEAYDYHWLSVHPYFDNYLNPLALIPELGLDRVLLAPRGGNSRGVEISAHDQVGEHWMLSGSYTLSRVVDDLPLQEIPRGWDQTHAVNWDVTWRRATTSASLVLSWHSGWPSTPIVWVPAAGQQPAYLQVGPRNSSRWGNYLSVDARVSHTFALPIGELDLWIDGTNLLNRGNPCCSTYAVVSAAGQLLAPVTTAWFPRVINLGFEWRTGPGR